MIKKNKTAYVALLLAVTVLLAAAVPGVGDVRAHYSNTICWNTIMAPIEHEVTSDCLMSRGQTVLLGEVTQECWIKINLDSDEPLQGTLSWDYVNPDMEAYLMVDLLNEQIYFGEEEASAYLILTPTDVAAELENELTVDVLVSFWAEDGQNLYGTFRAILPKVIKEEPEEEKDDTYSVDDDTTITPDVLPDDDVYFVEDDTVIIPGNESDDEEENASSGDDVYSNGEDTDINPDITPDEGTDEEEDTSSGDDVYHVEDDTVIIPGIESDDEEEDTSSGDDVYSNDEDTDINPDITPDDETDEEEDTSSSDDVYHIEDDTVIIPGIEPDDESDGEEDNSSGDDVYAVSDDTMIISGITTGEENDDSDTSSDNVDDASVIRMVFSGRRVSMSASSSSGGNIYSVADDTETIPEITTGDESTSEGGESVFENEEPSIVGEVYVNTLSSFSLNAKLPILLEMPQGSSRLVLNCAEGKLPAYTRYSINGGATWYMLYYGGSIDVNLFGQEELYLMLDLSYTNQQDSLTLTACVYAEEGKFVGEQTVEPYTAPEFLGTGTNYTDVVLGNESTLYFPLDFGGEECTKNYKMERLAVGENTAEPSYVPEDISLIDVGIEDNVLILTNRNSNLRAGTYRLTVEYYFSGICFTRSEYTFFVNYSGTT